MSDKEQPRCDGICDGCQVPHGEYCAEKHGDREYFEETKNKISELSASLKQAQEKIEELEKSNKFLKDTVNLPRYKELLEKEQELDKLKEQLQKAKAEVIGKIREKVKEKMFEAELTFGSENVIRESDLLAELKKIEEEE